MGSSVKKRLIAALRGHPICNIDSFCRDFHQAGYVVWDATPPAGVAYGIHRLTFLDAIEMASRFLRTDYAVHHEWLMFGEAGRSVIMTLPQVRLEYVEGHYPYDEGLQAVRLGSLFHRQVLFKRTMPFDRVLLFNDAGEVCHIQLRDML